MKQAPDEEFKRRQAEAQIAINQMDRETHRTNPRRDEFFETVYENADRDAALVPWADLREKDQIKEWLADNPGAGKLAIDVGCGIGDNAEALAAAGYETTAFDFSPKAIDWAKERFPESRVAYETGDLFKLPKQWLGAFDLVNECFTLQSLPPETLDQTIPAVCSLVAPGGRLLVYTRLRNDGTDVDGPPWPLERSRAESFTSYGLSRVSENHFIIEKGERKIDHVFSVWENKA